MTFHILTVFPGIFDGFLEETLIKRALDDKKLSVNLVNIRDFAMDKHKTTDDTPYGGGPGMVMKVEPIYAALKSLMPDPTQRTNHHVILLAARGKPFTQEKAMELSALPKDIVLICGRYEGVDQRVADHLADEELSIGPYVLSGGEVPAMVIIEATSRYIPGVLGNPDSLKEESFSGTASSQQPVASGTPTGYARRSTSSSVEYPQYTKPETFQQWRVPDILLSGNHKNIETWRNDQRKHL